MDLEKIYTLLPVIVQNLATSYIGKRLHRRRYSGEYGHIEKKVMDRQFLAGDHLKNYQSERLSHALSNAKKCPYWRDLFNECQVDSNSSNPFEELAKLPVLTKDTVKQRIDDFYNPEFSKKELLSRHTSGTTGGGLVFHETRNAEQECWATWWRYRQWHSITRDDWSGYFGGRSVVPIQWAQPPFWRINRPGKQVMFSTYHLQPSNCSLYFHEIQRRGLRWLHGYPSALAVFAAYLEEAEIPTAGSIDNVTVGAESLLPQQAALIKRVFQCTIRQHYGQAEGVANISECPHGKLHIDEDYSFVEFIPVDDTRDFFRMIGTNWSNDAFPLLRYDTGDLVKIAENASCLCGRSGRVVEEIDGRKEDFVLLPNGVKIGRLDHIFKDLIHVKEAQFRQEEQGVVQICIVKGRDYDAANEENLLLSESRKRLGNDIKIDIRYVDSIERTQAGKLRFVVSSLENVRN